MSRLLVVAVALLLLHASPALATPNETDVAVTVEPLNLLRIAEGMMIALPAPDETTEALQLDAFALSHNHGPLKVTYSALAAPENLPNTISLTVETAGLEPVVVVANGAAQVNQLLGSPILATGLVGDLGWEVSLDSSTPSGSYGWLVVLTASDV